MKEKRDKKIVGGDHEAAFGIWANPIYRTIRLFSSDSRGIGFRIVSEEIKHDGKQEVRSGRT